MKGVSGNRLRCESCSAEMGELDPRTSCPKCGGLLSVEIELPSERGATLRALFDGRVGATPRAGRVDIHNSGVWRFRELVLPGIDDEDLVTQWEGNTPLLARERVARWAEVPELLLKHEGHNPTGSFKDRGMTVAVSNAVRIGASAVSCASTGNTSASLAAYAALAGLPAIVLVGKRREVETVADKLHAIELALLPAADVPRKADAVAVRERTAFAADLHRDRGMAGGLDAEHANRLEIGAAIAGWLHAPGVEMILYI